MDLISLLAPYRSKPSTKSDPVTRPPQNQSSAPTSHPFQFTAKAKATPGVTTRSRTPSTSAQASAQSRKVTSQTQNRATVKPTGPAVVIEGNRFAPYHKKTNLQFGRHIDSQLINRRLNFAEAAKERRAKVMNNNRQMSFDKPLPAGNHEKPAESNTQSAQMEKLLRWKREKAELLKQQKQVKKPPMVSGIPKRPNGLLDLVPVAKSYFVATQTKIVDGKDKTRPIIGVGILKKSTPLAESMKNVNIENTVRNKSSIVESPAIAKPPKSLSTKLGQDHLHEECEEQNENENIPPKTAVLPLNYDSPVKNSAIAPSPATKKVGNRVGQIEHSPAIKKLVTMTRSPAINKVKKPKGMQLDSIYIDFHAKFVLEATTLSDYRDKWSKVVEDDVTGAIPEEILCEMESSIGQARLLLESKLPQFGELLYFYLSRTLNPHPILPCDLEGWWEVASISIEKVKNRFVKLEQLSRNRWKAGDRVPLKVL